MNDENFFEKSGGARGGTSFNSSKRTSAVRGLRSPSRQTTRAVGLAGMFLPIASTLVSHPPPGWWWRVGRLGVRLAAFSLADSEQGRRSA